MSESNMIPLDEWADIPYIKEDDVFVIVFDESDGTSTALWIWDRFQDIEDKGTYQNLFEIVQRDDEDAKWEFWDAVQSLRNMGYELEGHWAPYHFDGYENVVAEGDVKYIVRRDSDLRGRVAEVVESNASL